MFENAFNNIDDVLHKDAGCSNELDYVEQSSWVLFLKYLDDLEEERQATATLKDEPYSPLLGDDYRWRKWAAPRTADGKIDYEVALTGDDLIGFVNGQLFPYLAGFRTSAEGPATLEYKIGEIFTELRNKVQSGYNLREVLDLADQLRFRSSEDKHELSELYEAKIQRMGNAGRNGGEYYTPRPLIRAMVKVTDPRVGETVFDPACGSAGFLCEAFAYMSDAGDLSTSDVEALQASTFFGKEKKSLAYIIGIMNMILHGLDAPNLVHTNTLGENLNDIQAKDRHDIILANPPFGGKERKEVQQNFPVKTGETAFLFLQYFIKSLKPGGRAAIVIKNTFLSNTDNAAKSLRKQLLEECNLHTVLDCPSGTFQGAGVKTVALFFTKGEPTKNIWFYELDPGRNLGKTNPLSDEDLEDFVQLQGSKAESEKSWVVDVSEVSDESYDLSARNPNKVEEIDTRTPSEILDTIEELDKESVEILDRIRALL